MKKMYIMLLVLLTCCIAVGFAPNDKDDPYAPRTLLKGNLICYGWERGPIRILAFEDLSQRGRENCVGGTLIPEPGPYELKIRRGIKSVFLVIYNDSDNSGPPRDSNDAGWNYGTDDMGLFNDDADSALPINLDKPIVEHDIYLMHPDVPSPPSL